MPTLPETYRALYGAYRLARFDPSGMNWFDATIRGFWGSFAAAVWVAPLYVTILALRPTASADDATLRFILIKGIAYLVGWLAFPVMMITVTRVMGRWERFVPFLVAYNWCSVLQNVLYASVIALAAMGLLPAKAATFLSLVALGLVLGYSWFVARIALRIPPTAAGGVVAIDFFLGLLITSIADAMLRAGA